jgi:dihydrofolate reductase
MISIIVAIAENNAIGKDNELLWHIPEDLKRFKKITLGHSIIMGKRTWESLPVRPLRNRTNIILTDKPADTFAGAIAAFSIDDAINKCGNDSEIFIIGGGSVYNQFLNIADRLYITHVHKTFDADTFFPEINPAVWEPLEKEEHKSDEGTDFSYTYITYQRRGK